MQALSSVEGGYDLLAPKFDHTPFRTPDGMLDAVAGALRPLGPFGPGLDVCCGTGAGMRVLTSVCQGRLKGVDFSAGMLAQARRAHPDAQWVRADVRAVPFTGAFDLAVSFGALGHFLPAERPALFAGVYRALRPGGVSALPSRAKPAHPDDWPHRPARSDRLALGEPLDQERREGNHDHGADDRADDPAPVELVRVTDAEQAVEDPEADQGPH
jgi:SAM-dependent methyltransferase